VTVISPQPIAGDIASRLAATSYISIGFLQNTVDCLDPCLVGIRQFDLLGAIAESAARFVVVQQGDDARRYLRRMPGAWLVASTAHYEVYGVRLDRLRPIAYRPLYSNAALGLALEETGLNTRELRELTAWRPP
jgi:hypothetical protein